MITVVSLYQVTVDDVENAGSILSVCVNYQNRLAEIEAALDLYLETRKAQIDQLLLEKMRAEHAAELAEWDKSMSLLSDKHASDLANHGKANAQLIEEYSLAMLQKDQQIADQQKQIDEFTTFPEQDWKQFMSLLLNTDLFKRVGDHTSIDRAAVIGAIYAEDVNLLDQAISDMLESMVQAGIEAPYSDIESVNTALLQCQIGLNLGGIGIYKPIIDAEV